MYKKILNACWNYSCDVEEKNICKVINRHLSKIASQLILQAYRQRLFNDPEFNRENFLADLKGYLKYLTIEQKHNQLSIESFTNNFLNRIKIEKIKQLLKHYGYWPAIACGEYGHAKIAYLSSNRKEVVRFYYARPANFLYEKLLGISEADINHAVDNNLLVVNSINVAGQPFDIQERALPLSEVFDCLRENSCSKIITEIEVLRKSNPLITDFIEDSDDNVGLVVRQDCQGNKKVYVVAFDLDLRQARQVTESSDQELLNLLRQQQFNSFEPKYLEYDYLVEFIPELQDLGVCLSSQ